MFLFLPRLTQAPRRLAFLAPRFECLCACRSGVLCKVVAHVLVELKLRANRLLLQPVCNPSARQNICNSLFSQYHAAKLLALSDAFKCGRSLGAGDAGAGFIGCQRCIYL